jgi:hypothetical protein
VHLHSQAHLAQRRAGQLVVAPLAVEAVVEV